MKTTFHNSSLLNGLQKNDHFPSSYGCFSLPRLCLTGSRLHDFSISVANSFHPNGSHSDFKSCYQHTGAVAGGATITVPCANGLVGKYVRVRIEGTPGVNEILSLCDLKVNGQGVPGKIFNAYNQSVYSNINKGSLYNHK